MLNPYEIEVLKGLRDSDVIGHNYLPIQTVERIIKWGDIAHKHGVRKKFKSVARRLRSRGYVSDHGKSLEVLSLTKEGYKLIERLEKKGN